MIIKFDTYIIATKNYPIQFGTSTGELTDEFSEALFHSSLALAQAEIKKYDAPDDFEIRNVVVECEL